MHRKPLQWLFLLLIILMITVAPANAQGEIGVVGVRIPAEEAGIETDLMGLDSERVIDYGAFKWAVIPTTDLVALDEAGVVYQATHNPYHLTLGGKTFDPLTAPPKFDTGWDKKSAEGQPGLSLIQFFGPTKDIWLQSLQAAGLEALQYIHPYTYLVWGNLLALDKDMQNEIVRWFGDYLPAYAVQPEYRLLHVDPIRVRAMIVPQAGLTETVAAIEALGGELLEIDSDADPTFVITTFLIPGARLKEAAALPGVYSLQPVPTDGGDRGEMSNQVNAGNLSATNLAFPGYRHWLSSHNLSGSGVLIANVDSGIDQTHRDLTNRMRLCMGLTCGGSRQSDHGTHTAGIMAGDGRSGVRDSYGFLRGLGMAPGANLIEQVYLSNSNVAFSLAQLMSESAQNRAVISGNSWGPSGSARGYDLDTRQVDLGVRDAVPARWGNQPLTYVLSMMNGYGGLSSQGTPDEAKNSFTIGSTYLQASNGSQQLRINDLSANTAHGPALDGRKIPHLVAPGSYVDSTLTNQRFGLMSGTSMASPQVSGAAALFFEQYRKTYARDPSPALVKAAFLPVAHDLSGYKDADGFTLGHPFDSKQGWGRLNVDAVLNPRGPVFFYDQKTILDHTGETWTTTLKTSDDLVSLRAMLVWTDAPGHGNGGSSPAWVNDLDLSLSIDGQTYFGNNFGWDGLSIPAGTPDSMNNTEGIFLEGPFEGDCTITVTAANISGDGVPNFGDSTDQDFALAVYFGNRETRSFYYFPIFEN